MPHSILNYNHLFAEFIAQSVCGVAHNAKKKLTGSLVLVILYNRSRQGYFL